MPRALPPGFSLCRWHTTGGSLRLLLSGCLLALVMSGCATGLQDHGGQNDHTVRTPRYRALAEELIADGRLLGALQVLNLLKTAEYMDFVHRDVTTATSASRPTMGARSSFFGLPPRPAVWAQRYAAIDDQVAALAAERGKLRALPTRTAAQDARLAQLEEVDLPAANWAMEHFLAELETALGQTSLAQEKVFSLRETQALMADLRDLGPGTVALHTFVCEEKYYVVLTTPDVQLARAVPLSAADLSRKVKAFREVLEAARDQAAPPDPRPLAHELYTLLVAPVAADLRAVHAQTLLWSLDGVLRYLPLAALYDGEHYLVEHYALVVFTLASLTRLKDAPQPHWRVLGLGVSKAQADLPALPGVIRELQGIIRDPASNATKGILPGTIKLDEAFTAPTMLADLRQGYPVVHIASHFRLRPGDEVASFLLLGNGHHLSLAEVKIWPAVLSGVDLLTLSACNTAIGGRGTDGKEVEGLAVLAQRQGAKAVLATLWPVADGSTQEVMQTFYRLRATSRGLSKAEALRQAQLRLLAGSGSLAPVAGGQRRGQEDKPEHPSTRPGFGQYPPVSYAHPYFWAPFILFGNWK